MNMQNGLFDWQIRFDQLDDAGDPLVRLNELIDWEMFRPMLSKIRKKERKSNAGRKPFDVVLMFKVLVIQSLYNLSDASTEYQIKDRISFMRFLGLGLSDNVPDEKTIWLFKEELGRLGLVKKVFEKFDEYLRGHGFSATRGQIVDASIVSVPKQRNSRDENRRIKDGQAPEEWNENKKRQKDTDARWAKRQNENFFGYKNHISVDVGNKFIRDYEVTDAAVHDSRVFIDLLDLDNDEQDVYADSAYRTPEHLAELNFWGFKEHLSRKGCRNKELTKSEKSVNKKHSRIRARIEHVFGVQAMKAGNLLLRSIGMCRAKIKIGLRNLAYNLDRYALLASSP